MQKQQRLFQQLEKQLAEINQKKSELEAKLADPSTYANAEQFKATEAAYKLVVQQTETVTKQYEDIFEKIMDLEEQLAGN